MRKTILLFVIFFSFGSVLEICSQEKVADCAYCADVPFIPLSGDEYLKVELGGDNGRTMIVFAEDSHGAKRQIGNWADTDPWGSLQFFKSKRSLFFMHFQSTYRMGVYIIDGDSGKVRLIDYFYPGYKSTLDGRYIVFDDDHGMSSHPLIKIFDVKKEAIVEGITWPIGLRDGDVLIYLRENTGRYIKVAQCEESMELAEGQIDMNTLTLKMLWDKSATNGVPFDDHANKEPEIGP